MDQCIGSYTTNSKSWRWTHTSLTMIMDTVRVNGTTATALNKGLDPKDVNKFEWGIDLCTDLVTPHIKKRLQNKDSINRDTIVKMNLFLNRNVPDQGRTTALRRPLPEPGITLEGPGEPRKCYFCIDELPRHESKTMLNLWIIVHMLIKSG